MNTQAKNKYKTIERLKWFCDLLIATKDKVCFGFICEGLYGFLREYSIGENSNNKKKINPIYYNFFYLIGEYRVTENQDGFLIEEGLKREEVVNIVELFNEMLENFDSDSYDYNTIIFEIQRLSKKYDFYTDFSEL